MTQTAEQNVLDEDVDLDPHSLDVGKLAGTAALALGLFHFWASWSGGFPLLQMRSVHVGGVLVVLWLVLLHQSKRRRSPIVIGATVLTIAVSVYFMGLVFVSDDEILRRFTQAPDWQLVLGLIVLAICLEASRRVMGLMLPGMVLVSCAVVLLADNFDWLRQYIIPVDAKDLVNTLTFSSSGLFGSITGTSAGVIASFLILGSFLTASGGSQSFLNLARFLVGRFRGGPAKVSLLTSALFGTVSGSAVANVVVDGVFNIPLMKRSGYRPEFAAAVEANASTGGQIVPPVMGSAAFIMAEFLGISYSRVLLAAIIPAALYYLALLITCHVEALKLGLPAIPKKQLPRANTLITREFIGSFALPLTVLMVMLYTFDRSLLYSSWAATVTVILYMLTMMRLPFRQRVRKIIDAFRLSGIEIARIGAIVVAAQLIVTVMGISGIGPRIANELAGRDLPLALTLAILGITVIIIGFPLPTAPAYILAASVANPLFIALGIDMLAGHMFLLYFAVYGNVTPPVMPSVYPAAAIARCDAMKAGWEATRLLAPAVLVPFAFVLEPGILLTHGTFLGIVTAVLRMSIGIAAVSCGLAFWAVRPLPKWSGLLLAASGLFIAWPGVTSTFIGAAAAALALLPVFVFYRSRSSGAEVRTAGALAIGTDAGPEVRGDDWKTVVRRSAAVYELREIGAASKVAFGALQTPGSLAAVLGACDCGATVLLLSRSTVDAAPEVLAATMPALALGPDDVIESWKAVGVRTASWEDFSDRVSSTAPARTAPTGASTTVALLGRMSDDQSAVVREETAAARTRRAEAMAGSFGFTARDRLLVPASLDAWWALAFAEAALEVDALVIIEPSTGFDPGTWLAAIEATEASSAVLGTAMLAEVVEHCAATGTRPPESLTAVIHGGDPCDVATKRAGVDLFGPILIEFIGGADLAGTVILCEDWLDDVDCLGRPWSDDIKILVLDESGQLVGTDVPGRVALVWTTAGTTISRVSPSGERRIVDESSPHLTGLTGSVDHDGRLHIGARSPFEEREAVLTAAAPERTAIAVTVESITHPSST